MLFRRGLRRSVMSVASIDHGLTVGITEEHSIIAELISLSLRRSSKALELVSGGQPAA